MLTDYKKPESTETPTGPTAAATAAYRATVQSNSEADPAVLRDACAARGDFAIDRHVWEQRQAAGDTLKVRLPALEVEVQQVQFAATTECTTAARALTDFATIGELLTAIEKTIQERSPTYFSPARIRLRECQDSLAETRRLRLRPFAVRRLRKSAAGSPNSTTAWEMFETGSGSLWNSSTSIPRLPGKGSCATLLGQSRNERDKQRYREALRPTVRATQLETAGPRGSQGRRR